MNLIAREGLRLKLDRKEPRMHSADRLQLARDAYEAYKSGDRGLIERVIESDEGRPSDAFAPHVDIPGGVVLPLVMVALVGVLSALGVHSACFNATPPVAVPEPGTPRAEYCSAVIGAKPWLLLTIVPCALVAVAARLVRRPGLIFVLAIAICVVLVANMMVAADLGVSAGL